VAEFFQISRLFWPERFETIWQQWEKLKLKLKLKSGLLSVALIAIATL
jgi:hypothetical protein